METPKHLMAIAVSNSNAAEGKVIWPTAEKEACLWPGASAAQRDRRYKPKNATLPENAHVIMPPISPADAIAYAVQVKQLVIGAGN